MTTPQVLYLDDVDFPVKPVICYGTEKLIRAYSGNCMRIRNFADSLNHEVPFNADGSISVATHITPFVGAGANDAATVQVWYDQTTNAKNAVKSSYRAPKIKDKNVGTKPAVIFEGLTQSGKVFALDIDFNGTGIGGPAGGYTVFAVMRPTNSTPRNQNVTSGLSPNGGTVLSIEAKIPVTVTGTTVLGVPSVTVTDASNIFPNMWCQGAAFGEGVSVLGKVGNVVSVVGSNALLNDTGLYKFTETIARLYSHGSGTIGGFSTDDRVGVNVKVDDVPVEIGPSVVCWSQGSNGIEGSVGTRIFQNEHGASSSLISSKVGSSAFYGFLGCSGNSIDIGGGSANETFASGRNGAGDFWISALVIYNTVLTAEQRAYVSAALYDRFHIPEARSRTGKTALWATGDSIGHGYVCLGVDGMFNVVQDALSSSVRVFNYCVAGSSNGPGILSSDPTLAMKNAQLTAITPMMRKTHNKKLFVTQGAGNDMNDITPFMADNVTPFAFVSFAGGGTITTTANHGLAVGGRVAFTAFSGGTGVTPGTVGTVQVYWVRTVGSPTTFTISTTPGGATVTFTGSPTATMFYMPKTATSCFNDTLSMVQEAYNNGGATRVFVCTLTPRATTVYLTILTDYNTMVAANAVANNYTVIDLYSLFPSHLNGVFGSLDTTNFADSIHLNRTGHVAAGNAIVTAITPFI